MEKNNFAKNLLVITGFVAAVVAIAGAVYAALKYFEKRKTEEFMDYYFDEDDDFSEDSDKAIEETFDEDAPVEE